MEASIPKLDWKNMQVFGDKAGADKVSDQDIISALAFDKSGNFLSLGDKAGRLIVFELQTTGKNKKAEYQYLTELQSHTREFDFLKSTDIQQKINQMQWLRAQGNNHYIVTTNDKTVKVWKISQKNVQKVIKGSGKELNLPKLQTVDSGLMPTIRKVYPNLHNFNVNSISIPNNEEFVLSSDDLRVYLWSLEQPNKAFIAIDLKPENLDDISQVITSSQYHPLHDSMFVYATSKGVVKIADMRKTGVCDSTALTLLEKDENVKKNFFTEIVASISDCSWTQNGRYILSRDFLNVQVWDINMTNQPVANIPIFEPLKSKLCELYENQCIFDQFSISSSSDSNYFITGNFNSCFHIVDRKGENNSQFELNFNKQTVSKNIPPQYFENLGNSYDYTQKVLQTAFHPQSNTIAVACLNSLHFYNTG